MAVVVTVVEIAKCAQQILAAAPARSPACQVALAVAHLLTVRHRCRGRSPLLLDPSLPLLTTRPASWMRRRGSSRFLSFRVRALPSTWCQRQSAADAGGVQAPHSR